MVNDGPDLLDPARGNDPVANLMPSGEMQILHSAKVYSQNKQKYSKKSCDAAKTKSVILNQLNDWKECGSS